MPVVSVIVPVHNAEKYLRQCIDSVLQQNLKDIEVICVDDGSSDRSPAILEAYSRLDSRVIVCAQHNAGAGAARNVGLASSHGKYVHFLDADDWVDPEVYESTVRKLDESGADVAVFQYVKYDNVTGSTKQMELSLDPRSDAVSNLDENPKYFFHNAVVPWNKLYRRSLIIENNMRFDEIVCANDRSFYVQTLLAASRILITPESFLHYRVNNNDSLVGLTRLRNFDCHFRSYERIWSLCQGLSDDKKAMVTDITVRDFFNFYHRAEGELRWSIYRSLHDYFQHMDVSHCSSNPRAYSWYEEYLEIKAGPFSMDRVDRKEAELRTLTRSLSEARKQIERLSLQLAEAKGKYAKIRRSHSFRAGRVVMWAPRKLKGIAGTLVHSGHGVSRAARRRPKVIVSLTSFPARIPTLHVCVDSLLSQSLKPDKVLLWLAEEEFPGRERDLPSELLALKKRGLTIRWCENLRSYKKLIPALKEYPRDIIVTADDDNRYAPQWLERLYVSYRADPTCVHCHRVTRFYPCEGHFEIVPGGASYYGTPSLLNKQVGLGGVLYPPDVLHPDVMRRDLFEALAPTSDDIWFWLTGVLRGTRVRVADEPLVRADYIEGTQSGPTLTAVNDHGEVPYETFFKHFNNVLDHYPSLKEMLVNDYERVGDSVSVSAKQNPSPSRGGEMKTGLAQNQRVARGLRARIKGAAKRLPGVRGLASRLDRLRAKDRSLERQLRSQTGEIEALNRQLRRQANTLTTLQRDVNYKFYQALHRDDYEEALAEWYTRRTGEVLDFDNPLSYNQKIQWLKLYDSTALKTLLSDKYLVRDWAAAKIGSEHLIPLLGVWDKFDDIDFESLPERFVLKANHGSGYNLVVADKSALDVDAARRKFNRWMVTNFAFSNGLELHYKDIKRKILAEQFIENEDGCLFDYRFYCFGGVPYHVWVDVGSGTPQHKRDIYDLEWNLVPLNVNYPNLAVPRERPENLKLMIDLARTLSEGLVHVRVDFYEVKGKIYLGEMTFTPQSGTGKWDPVSFDYLYGSLIQLPSKQVV